MGLSRNCRRWFCSLGDGDSDSDNNCKFTARSNLGKSFIWSLKLEARPSHGNPDDTMGELRCKVVDDKTDSDRDLQSAATYLPFSRRPHVPYAEYEVGQKADHMCLMQYEVGQKADVVLSYR